MSNGIFESTTIPVLQEAIGFAQARHGVHEAVDRVEVLGNVANLDTPGYKVRDLSVETFQERLSEAIQARRERNEHVSPGILTDDPGDPMRKVRDSMKSILYHDESNVGIEQQVLEISKNQFMHNLAISILSSQLRMLQTAISERV